MLTGRGAECATLEQLIASVRAGESQALVVHGEAGVGKTALLEHVAGRAAGCRVARTVGVESEMELAFAGLRQLCAQMLPRMEGLPPPQRDAMRTAFGMSAGPPPDRFLVALAVLSLLSDVAEGQPLLCLVDDVQWLDQVSAQVLAFVARRLVAEPLGVIFTTRVLSGHLVGLPEMHVSGLAKADALALLHAALPAPLDAQICDLIVAETRGNPLALLELPRGLTSGELAGGFGLPGAGRFSHSVEDSFRRRLESLPTNTQTLLLIAAAETSGDPALLWRAAARMGIGADAAPPAVDAKLVEFGTRVQFRHPLVRSVVYRSARLQDRRHVHHALAAVIDAHSDADRRAWHRANSATGPNENVAAELEQSAGRARARGGLSAAAAFLERATMLTPDPATRAGRALNAASAKVDAGAFDAVLDLLVIAEMGPLNDFEQARLDLVRAQLAFVTSRGNDAPPLLLKAAERLEPIDPSLARATYLDALSATIFAGRLAAGSARQVARHAGSTARGLRDPRAPDLLLDGFATHYNEGFAAAVPILRSALTSFSSGMPAADELRWMWLASLAALHVGDDERWYALSGRHVQLARDVGAFSELPLALSSRAYTLLFAGELTAAAALVEEVQTATETTGSNLALYGALGVAAFRGRHAEVSDLVGVTIEDATRRGEGNGITSAEWALALVNNGAGRYQEAMTAAQRATAYPDDVGGSRWALVELIEAAVRSEMHDVAASAHQRLRVEASASATDWALGVEARSLALLTEGGAAERLYQESIERLCNTRMQSDLGRAHLVYGEWLRREGRASDARAQLHVAHDRLQMMGMKAFAERARRELRASGELAPKRTHATGNEQLTAQEMQVACLARDGLTNFEIGARLFISAHTVQYHLKKVFAKFAIHSRSELEQVLPSGPAATTS